MELLSVEDVKRAILLAILVIATIVYICCAEEDYCEPTVPCNNITCPQLCGKNARAYCKPGDEFVSSCCCHKQSNRPDVRRLLLSK
uniref:Uncharacterized protein n=1 Tax=Oryza punctata TaxID=4537 RepID=A0A0E0L9B9_ORYPU